MTFGETSGDALPVGIIVVNVEGFVRSANPCAIAFLGVPLIGERWADVIQRGFVADGSADTRLADGRRVAVTTAAAAGGQGQVVVVQDITETRIEQERRAQDRAARLLGEKTARLAHQIRTPISSALLSVALARRSADAAKRDRQLDRIEGALKHLDRLVNDMLALGTGGIGGKSRFPIALVIDEAMRVAEGKLAGIGARAAVANDAPGVMAEGSSDLLASALANLLVNAAEAAGPQGAILISATTDGEVLDLAVVDDGPGIQDTLGDRVFEPFVSGRSGGTGLGLPVVRAIAEAHGGTAYAFSLPAGGARVGMRLPAIGSSRGPRARDGAFADSAYEFKGVVA